MEDKQVYAALSKIEERLGQIVAGLDTLVKQTSAINQTLMTLPTRLPPASGEKASPGDRPRRG